VADFRQFVSALEGEAVAITRKNIGGLSLLCDEFGFEGLATPLSEFRRSPAFKKAPTMEDTEARLRLSALEEQAAKRARAVASLRSDLSRLSEVQESTGRAAAAALERLLHLEAELARTQSPAQTPRPHGRSIRRSFQTFRKSLRSSAGSSFRSCGGAAATVSLRDFHSRCDGYASTLTVILDTRGNVFGGFTPVEWESRAWNGKFGNKNNCFKADPSLKGFFSR
jgi:hypothetical protein